MIGIDYMTNPCVLDSKDEFFEYPVELEIDELQQFVKEKYRALMQDLRDQAKRTRAKNEELWKANYQLRHKIEVMEKDETRTKQELEKKSYEELLFMFSKTIYTIALEYEYMEKCEFCDDKRKITLKDAFGCEFKHDCACDKKRRKYSCKEGKFTEVEVSGNKFKLLFENKKENVHDSRWRTFDDLVTSEEQFDKASSYKRYFIDKELAEKYVEHLNAQQEWENVW